MLMILMSDLYLGVIEVVDVEASKMDSEAEEDHN